MTTSLDAVFASLSDPTRRAIVERLTREREVPVGELARPFASTLPAVIKHLQVLEQAGLVERRRCGRQVLCSLRPQPMTTAQTWFDHNLAFWSQGLGRLQAFVQGDKQ